MKKETERKTRLSEYEFHAEGMTVTVMDGTPPIPFGREYTVEKPSRPMHTHSWYELFCVKKGALSFVSEKGEVSVGENELLFVAPSVSHYTEDADAKTEKSVFNFFVEKTASTPLSEKVLSFLSSGFFIHTPGDPSLSECAEALEDTIIKRNSAGAGCLILMLIMKAEEIMQKKEPDKTLFSDNDITRIYRLEQILNSHYRERIGMREVASALNISEKQLSRLCRKKYGCTFYERVTALRMKNGKALLSDGKSVSRAANDSGFESVQGFIGAFKKFYGTTPASFRKSIISRQILPVPLKDNEK